MYLESVRRSRPVDQVRRVCAHEAEAEANPVLPNLLRHIADRLLQHVRSKPDGLATGGCDQFSAGRPPSFCMVLAEEIVCGCDTAVLLCSK